MLHSCRNFPLRPSQQCQLPPLPFTTTPFLPFLPFPSVAFLFLSPRGGALTPFRPFYGLVTSNLRVAHFSRDKPGEAPTPRPWRAPRGRRTGPRVSKNIRGSDGANGRARAAAVTSTLPRRSAKKNIAGRSERGTVPELSFLRMHFAFFPLMFSLRSTRTKKC